MKLKVGDLIRIKKPSKNASGHFPPPGWVPAMDSFTKGVWRVASIHSLKKLITVEKGTNLFGHEWLFLEDWCTKTKPSNPDFPHACPECSSPAYLGGNLLVECTNRSCRHGKD